MTGFEIPWQAVFFDFDGVIVDAPEVKVRAFATLFAPYGQAVQEAVVRYHLENGGMPRHRKIRDCFEIFLGRSVDDRELDRIGTAFSGLVLEEVVAAPLVSGALSTLRQLREARIPAFVVSGTPHEEMGLIVARKGLQPYFLEVHGSPRAKPVIIREIIARHRYLPQRCLFIGDALADYRAALETGLHFLGITPAGQDSIFAQGVPTSESVTLTLRASAEE